MTDKLIKDLFANDIHRRIEEVIKVDQTDEEIIREELSEYIVTDAICDHYTEILDRYWETPKKPHEGIAIWISGFFGSGKSSFAKMLGLALENRQILGKGAADLFAQQTGDTKTNVLLKNISEHVPTDALIFDVSTDRGIRTGNQTLTEIIYRLFLQRIGYARDLDLAELEITLEAEGRLGEFKDCYAKLFNKDWNAEKGKVAFAISQASRVMHELDRGLYPAADSWVKAAKGRADVTPGMLAERCKELLDRRLPGRSFIFVIDEVGQFVARDVQKMLDLQAVVQSLGRVGRGRMWIAVTSQEKLGELVGGLDDKRVELARLMDRFSIQVHLEPSDISEVTGKRVLSKNAEAQKALRELYTEYRGRLTDNTRMTADIKLPELTAESFIDLYPLLPYQIDLIIQVVSGLRTQSGASKHVGGANRTIIKLAQQLLIHPGVDIAGQPLKALARIDQVYDLVSGNIASEIRRKIDNIGKQVDHSLAQSVSKAICLLQYVKSIHRTPENIAAALHPAVDADSRLPQVREALELLSKAHMVRLGDDGYRIPSPVEDDWEKQRSSISPKPGDTLRIHAEVITGLWQPQPSHNFMGTKVFKAALFFNGKEIVPGDIPVHLTLAEAEKDFENQVAEMRQRSQAETKSIFWVAMINGAIDKETVEVFRSKEILSRKERGAQTKDETALVAEEKIRLRRHQDELKRLIKQACLTGSIFFRGNDRSPGESITEVGQAAAGVLAKALPEVYDRFQEAAASVQKKDLESLLTTENLRGLTPLFVDLKLIRDEKGKPVFNVESGPLAEIMSRIENRTSYGETASGRYLSDEFAREPYGWDFDMVRILVLSLLRAGKIDTTSKGQLIESVTSIEAQNTFLNNNLFRQASFRPKMGLDFTHLIQASEAFKDAFGRDIPELEQSVAAGCIRTEVGKYEDALSEVRNTLSSHALPGAEILQEALNHMRAIRTGNEEQAILEFNASYKEIKEAIKRAAEINAALTEPRLLDLDRARKALRDLWPFLQGESDLQEETRVYAEQLADLMERETFYKELPAIDQHARALEEEHRRRYEEALQQRAKVYTTAIEQLEEMPGWETIQEEQRRVIVEPLVSRASTTLQHPVSVPLLRADIDAVQGRVDKAVEVTMQALEGERVVQIKAAKYFKGGVETEEQLEAALQGLREECESLIGAGKKILIQ